MSGPITVLSSSGLPIAKDLYAAKSLFRTFDATDSWMITRRVEVQRCPAVPTAPKKIDCVAISMSALGGNNALIVAPSADIDMATQSIFFGAVGTAGQACTSKSRVIVHGSIACKGWRQVWRADKTV